MLEDVKYVSNASLLVFVVKGDGSQGRKSKVIEKDSDSDGTDDEFMYVEKTFMVSNPKKFFKKIFSRFKSKN